MTSDSFRAPIPVVSELGASRSTRYPFERAMMGAALLSDEEGASAEAFELAVLESLDLAEASDSMITRWAQVYEHVHAVLVGDAGGSPGPSAKMTVPASKRWGQEDLDAVWGLIYAARTFQVARRILRAYPPARGALLDIGAGWGPFGFAAALLDPRTPIELRDVSAERLNRARRLFAAAGLPTPAIEVADAADFGSRRAPELAPRLAGDDATPSNRVAAPPTAGAPHVRKRTLTASSASPRVERRSMRVPASEAPPSPRPPSTGALGGIAIPYSLGELLGGRGSEEAADWLSRWTRELAPGGTLYVLEPGSRASSRKLQEARDLVVRDARATVIAPCAGPPTCPLLLDPRDWCHFTWRMPLGPIARRIADRARLRWQELSVSWLLLGRADEPKALAPREMRLLELRPLGAGKLGGRFCTREGALTLTALNRNRETVRKLGELEPGARVRLRDEHTTAKGDGLRLDDARALEVEGSI